MARHFVLTFGWSKLHAAAVVNSVLFCATTSAIDCSVLQKALAPVACYPCFFFAGLAVPCDHAKRCTHAARVLGILLGERERARGPW